MEEGGAAKEEEEEIKMANDVEMCHILNNKVVKEDWESVVEMKESTEVDNNQVPGCSRVVDKEDFKDVEMMKEDEEQKNETTETIRRRRSGSNKRNYRQAVVGVGVPSSNEDEDEPRSSSLKLEEIQDPEAGPSTNSNQETDSAKKQEEQVGSVEAEPITPHGLDLDDNAMSHGANSSSPTVSDQSGDHEGEDGDESGNRRRLEYLIAGAMELDGNASSSSSLEFLGDEDELEEDSSSSSSDALEDLEDRPSGGGSTAGRKSSNAPIKDDKTKKKPTDKGKKKDDQNLPKVLQKPKPKSNWCGPKEVLNRELGYRNGTQAQGFEVFRSKFYGSLYSAERLELMKKLEGHRGCVNCLHFNYAGTKLASGSDDLQIKLWNYGQGTLLTSFHSKHKSNVFQAKFMPLRAENIIVSCARDAQVRLAELDSTGAVAASRQLAKHRSPAHKLAINPETPHVVLSCGEDGAVFSCDIREDNSQRILSVVENDKKVALYSIHSNPLHSTEFCVSGRDEYLRIYDTRKLSRSSTSASNDGGLEDGAAENEQPPLKRYCPHHLQGHQSKPHITAAVYNYNGTELIASYNDENIYLFDNSHSTEADYVKYFEGHLNSATVKGVNYFGDKSQFVVSGSDCGHVFIWDKETEGIVNFFRGDENGVVNCLEPHPSAPILATSGLDDDVKIWIPSSETPTVSRELNRTVTKNIKRRVEEMESRPNALDGQIMWQLIHHLHREQRRNRRATGEDVDSDSSSGSGEEGSGMDCVIS